MKYIDIGQANVVAEGIVDLLDSEDMAAEVAIGGLIYAIHEYLAYFPEEAVDEVIALIDEWPLDGGGDNG